MKNFAKKLMCAGVCAALLMSVFLSGASANTADSGTYTYENLNGKNWMSGISGDRYLYEINLPGSHDSAMINCKNSTNNYVKLFGISVFNSGKYAKTQSLSIPQQLEAGVRYLDLRFSAKQGRLLLCHGDKEDVAALEKLSSILKLDTEFYAYEDAECTVNSDYESAITQIKDFLKENPSEAVIVCAKRENGDRDAYLELLKEKINELKEQINPSTKKGYLYTENGNGTYSRMPILSEIRGQIVFVSPDYEQLQTGDKLDSINGAGQTDFMGVTFNYENHWDVTAKKKVKYIKSFIEEFSTDIKKNPQEHLAYANIIKTSSNAVARQCPQKIEDKVKEEIFSRQKLIKGRYYGWITGDFMSEEKCSAVWSTNYFYFEK